MIAKEVAQLNKPPFSADEEDVKLGERGSGADWFRRRGVTWFLATLVLATLLVTVNAAPALAAPAFVQKAAFTSTSNSSTIAATFSSTTTVGNTIVASYTFDDGGGTSSSCSDSSGNTYAVAVSKDDASNQQVLAVCYAYVSTAGTSTVTVTLPGSVGFRALAIHEYSGIASSGAVDVTASTTASSSANVTDSVTSTAATTTSSNDLIFGAFMDVSGGSSPAPTAGTNFTLRNSSALQTAGDFSSEDRVFSSTGSVAATETWTRSNAYIGVMVAFRQTTTKSASLYQSSPIPSASSVQHLFALDGVTVSAIKCVKVTYSVNVDGTGGKPSGMSVASATLDATTTWPATPASWTVTKDNVNGIVSLTYATGTTPASPIGRSLVLNNLTNPNSATVYYATIASYTNTNCSTGNVDTFTLAVPTTGGVATAVTVDPQLTFSVAGRASVCNGQSSTNFQTGSTGTAVSLGRLTAATVAGGAQDLSVTSNAESGFIVTLRTTGTTPNVLRDAFGHSIADVTGTAAAPSSAPSAGTAAFGFTSSDTSTAFTSNKWAKITNSPQTVITASAGTTSKSACIGFEAAAASTTNAGLYNATIVYAAIPTY